MAIPNLGSWNLVRIYGTWRRHSGVLIPGTAVVTIPVRLVAAGDDAILPAGQFYSGPLNTVQGAPSLDLQVPSTDDPDITAAAPWLLQVVITLEGAAPETFRLPVPLATPEPGINLLTITPVG